METPKLLFDNPAKSDKIEGRPFEKVADTLTKIITDERYKEGGALTIALEGTWGSGKSTVVTILKDKLKTCGKGEIKFPLFIYDVWAHEGDSLRRSFLEKLIDFVVDFLVSQRIFKGICGHIPDFIGADVLFGFGG